MIGNSLALDTNIIIDLFKGDKVIFHNLQQAEEIKIPFVVLGELLYGALRSSNPEKHLSQISGFASQCTVLFCDVQTTFEYARIKSTLLKKGKPIPENDICIAAVAIQKGLKLISRDKHFAEIDLLTTESWS